MAFTPEVVSTEVLARSKVFDVERLELRSDATTFTREVVRHPGAVAVLAHDGDAICLVRQWRAPLGTAILEIPAGTRDVAGEPPEVTAVRELEEEAGVHAGRVELLCEVWNSPGWSDQRTAIYLATSLTTVQARPTGPEEAAISVVWMPLRDALDELSRPGPHDASTTLAITLLAARLGVRAPR